jgi:hydrogenase maturation factor
MWRPASGRDAAACDPRDGCITCGDEAVPMRILQIDARRGLALCEDGGGGRSTVEVELVAPVAEGETILVHAGAALARAAAEGAA